MNNRRQGPRAILPVRLNSRERALAEAIAQMHGESGSAGFGIRTALRLTEDRINATGNGDELRRLVDEIETERAERDA